MTDIVERAADVLERIAHANCADPATDDLTVHLAIELAEMQETLRLANALVEGANQWQPISTRPEIDQQPSRQFILIEGSTNHSGASWYRQHAGEAYIRKPGGEDEILQYRGSDVLRICKDGDIDPITARVTHWMPGKYPQFPSTEHPIEGAK